MMTPKIKDGKILLFLFVFIHVLVFWSIGCDPDIDGSNVYDTNSRSLLDTVVNSCIQGTYSMVAVHSGKALDCWNWGATDGINIAQYDFWGGEVQKFSISRMNGIWHRITPLIATGQAMDVSG
jgi:hypothetical protein